METTMSHAICDIWKNIEVARKAALQHNYETSTGYYRGAIEHIRRLVSTSINDPTRKNRWLTLQRELEIECDQVTVIQTFLNSTTCENPVRRTWSSRTVPHMEMYQDQVVHASSPQPEDYDDDDVWSLPIKKTIKPPASSTPVRQLVENKNYETPQKPLYQASRPMSIPAEHRPPPLVPRWIEDDEICRDLPSPLVRASTGRASIRGAAQSASITTNNARSSLRSSIRRKP